MAGSHELPSLPPASSPRRGRGISFSGKSDKSHRSSGSGAKTSYSETHEEKAKRLLHTKADPTLAMNEAQPAAVALEKSNLGSLRSGQYKDQYGNIITDPDISNPTRPRLERPLDTIRSFEAAIDGSYNSRRLSYAATESNAGGYGSRPGSYHGPSGGNVTSNRYNDQNYGRASYSRPDSYIENYGPSGPSQQYNSHYPYNQNGGRPPRPRHNGRMNSEYGNGVNTPNVYPQHAYQQSNDNMTAGSGSNNTDQWGNSTDPSSVNSSMDRLQQQLQNNQPKPEIHKPAETYGFNGFGPGPQFSAPFQDSTVLNPPPPTNQSAYVNGTNGMNGYGQAPPQLPAKDTTAVPSSGRGILRKSVSEKPEKRLSWFKRRFSRD